MSVRAILSRADDTPLCADLCVSLGALAANTGATLTLPAAGAGQFHYVIAIHVMRAASAALTGNALLAITTTNLPGPPVWAVGNAMAAGGTSTDMTLMPGEPIKSLVANTATTVVLPAPGAAVSWRAQVFYRTGP